VNRWLNSKLPGIFRLCETQRNVILASDSADPTMQQSKQHANVSFSSNHFSPTKYISTLPHNMTTCMYKGILRQCESYKNFTNSNFQNLSYSVSHYYAINLPIKQTRGLAIFLITVWTLSKYAWLTDLVGRSCGENEFTVRVERQTVDFSSVSVHSVCGFARISATCVPATHTPSDIDRHCTASTNNNNRCAL